MLAVVARYTTVGEAESSRTALVAAGIDSAVVDENVVSVDWLMSQAVGGVKLLVPRERLEEAAEVLAGSAREMTSEDEQLESVVIPEEPAEAGPALDEPCPECGSSDLQRFARLQLFIALSIIALGVGVAAGQPELALVVIVVIGVVVLATPSRRCRACGERWTAKEPEPEESFGAPPEPSDRIETPCPRCGSREYYHVIWRRVRAASLLFSFGFLLIMPVWVLLPKWKCDSCGLRRWFR